MLGEQIATHRNNKGLTQAQLGRMIGVGQSTVAMYERNAIRPSWRRLEQLTAALDIEVGELFNRPVDQLPSYSQNKQNASPHICVQS